MHICISDDSMRGEHIPNKGEPLQEMGWKRSDVVLSTKIFWGGSGPNDKGLSRKHIVEGTKVCTCTCTLAGCQGILRLACCVSILQFTAQRRLFLLCMATCAWQQQPSGTT